ncbi:MAG: hypothetical protein F9K30_05705 [Dechloromonas sp.]|nr:MAG: hypothetical protein F9K30_05705 [Dechloromonas sp.]
MSDSRHHEDSQPLAGSTASESRRRFVRGVGLATPVMLAVSSRSALATGGTCLSPSASASIALTNSRPNRDGIGCSGRSPGFWSQACLSSHQHYSYWTMSGASGKLFSTVFNDSSAFPGKTLKDVLRNGMAGSPSFADPNRLGFHLAAAWCNLQVGFVPSTVVSLLQLRAMWAGRNLGYQPVPGMGEPWYGEKIVKYLETTYTAG